MIDFRGGVTYAPRTDSHLSADKRQQHHDRFFAYYNLLHDLPALPSGDRRKIAATCAAITWKAVRRSGLPLAQIDALVAYLRGKAGFSVPADILDRAAAAFRSLPGIRHTPASVPKSPAS
jgi:hypothetical protein